MVRTLPYPALFRRHAEHILFAAFWLGLVVFCLMADFDRGMLIYNKSNRGFMPLGVMLEVLSKGLFVYLHVEWLLMGLLMKRQYVRYVINLLILIILFCGIETFIEYYLVPSYYPGQERPGWATVLSWNLPAYTLEFILYSYIYGFVKAWVLNERQKKQLAEEKVRTELAFLKAQVNPHFLFNTLNNLFSMAHMDNSPATASGIMKLSNMMRYMLHESNVDLIPLEKEVNYIRSYIELERLRFSEEDDIRLEFCVQGEPVGKQVAPMLLIPFVENAFKHGITLQGKCEILITLQVEAERLRLQVRNTINKLRNQSPAEASGLGLENVRRRLELLYPQRHQLQVDQANGIFNVSFEINF